MPQQPETKFKERVFRDLKALAPYVWFTKIQQVGICGTPDVFVCARGNFIVLELKKDKHSKATPLQLWELNAIAIANGMSFITYPSNWPKTLQAIKNLCGFGEGNDEELPADYPNLVQELDG